jgi:hypothetical protein
VVVGAAPGHVDRAPRRAQGHRQEQPLLAVVVEVHRERTSGLRPHPPPHLVGEERILARHARPDPRIHAGQRDVIERHPAGLHRVEQARAAAVVSLGGDSLGVHAGREEGGGLRGGDPALVAQIALERAHRVEDRRQPRARLLPRVAHDRGERFGMGRPARRGPVFRRSHPGEDSGDVRPAAQRRRERGVPAEAFVEEERFDRGGIGSERAHDDRLLARLRASRDPGQNGRDGPDELGARPLRVGEGHVLGGKVREDSLLDRRLQHDPLAPAVHRPHQVLVDADQLVGAVVDDRGVARGEGRRQGGGGAGGPRLVPETALAGQLVPGPDPARVELTDLAYGQGRGLDTGVAQIGQRRLKGGAGDGAVADEVAQAPTRGPVEHPGKQRVLERRVGDARPVPRGAEDPRRERAVGQDVDADGGAQAARDPPRDVTGQAVRRDDDEDARERVERLRRRDPVEQRNFQGPGIEMGHGRVRV